MTKPVNIRRVRSTWAWQKLAERTIREEPLCWLQLPGCTRVSTTADHIIAVVDRPDLALVRSNTRGACRHCNYARRDTPVNQLHRLRSKRSTRRERKPPAALQFFNPVNQTHPQQTH